ncbi:hypothetical protein KFL_000770180 [Klebsormidium nitens]|uniref:Uncharacterized protein n=1 Tax=Klebsormidium nitens TaxID=105231 RepID=A0A1Y1HRR7_KLENI|nr:hypothetical protein KFL_000770180 [Klebsormidium nitens]|eukprot:GAQ81325.1 hypothetical protein KFL_000770180 [Klebsormidium nitens]
MARVLALLVVALLACTQVASAQIVGNEGNPAKKCVDQYWASGQKFDSFGCLSKKIVCVDIVVSGQTVTTISDASITDQDFYNIIHNGIAGGGGSGGAFGVNFQSVSSLASAGVAPVDNVLSAQKVKFVTSQNIPVGVCSGVRCFKNTVPEVMTITSYPIGPFDSNGGKVKNKGTSGGDRCIRGVILPDSTPPNVGVGGTIHVQTSSADAKSKSLCGAIGVAGAVAGALVPSGIPGVLAAIGSLTWQTSGAFVATLSVSRKETFPAHRVHLVL